MTQGESRIGAERARKTGPVTAGLNPIPWSEPSILRLEFPSELSVESVTTTLLSRSSTVPSLVCAIVLLVDDDRSNLMLGGRGACQRASNALDRWRLDEPYGAGRTESRETARAAACVAKETVAAVRALDAEAWSWRSGPAVRPGLQDVAPVQAEFGIPHPLRGPLTHITKPETLNKVAEARGYLRGRLDGVVGKDYFAANLRP
eukprot:1942434-Rhodomonas_salina.1